MTHTKKLTRQRRRALERQIRLTNADSILPLREVGTGPYGYTCIGPEGMTAFSFQTEVERQAGRAKGVEVAHIYCDALLLIDAVLTAAATAKREFLASGMSESEWVLPLMVQNYFGLGGYGLVDDPWAGDPFYADSFTTDP